MAKMAKIFKTVCHDCVSIIDFKSAIKSDNNGIISFASLAQIMIIYISF